MGPLFGDFDSYANDTREGIRIRRQCPEWLTLIWQNFACHFCRISPVKDEIYTRSTQIVAASWNATHFATSAGVLLLPNDLAECHGNVKISHLVSLVSAGRGLFAGCVYLFVGGIGIGIGIGISALACHLVGCRAQLPANYSSRGLRLESPERPPS